MAKVLEGPGMGLMKKWGITVPHYVVVTSVDELTKLGQANEWLKKSKLVVKAHEALGSRFKLGLVKVGLDLKEAEAATKESGEIACLSGLPTGLSVRRRPPKSIGSVSAL